MLPVTENFEEKTFQLSVVCLHLVAALKYGVPWNKINHKSWSCSRFIFLQSQTLMYFLYSIKQINTKWTIKGSWHMSLQSLKRECYLETGVLEEKPQGAMLRQRCTDGKTRPWAFFSRSLFSAENNYDVGDHEVLAVKLALEKWRHWVEGAKEPFVIWSDHKNLQCLKVAKRLNPRWILFFNCFNFSLSYWPGSKNINPYALSMKLRRRDRRLGRW